MHRIKFEDLSLTFKDAVKICRDLNLRYLWIDSLCIIQDDGEDWSEQAMAMASIYGGSYLTLSALGSVDGTLDASLIVTTCTLRRQRSHSLV
jgi:Heterokaryon incompatibility protein (HET)